jgi:hypothetical protein
MIQISKPITVVLLWLWSGAAIMLLIVTATLFSPVVLENRELSGAISGAILKRFFLASNYLFGVCVLISLLGWLVDMKTKKRMEILFFVTALLLGFNLFQDAVVRKEMVRIKVELKNATAHDERISLAAQFKDWHRISMGLFCGSLAIALITAGWVTLHTTRKAGKKAA